MEECYEAENGGKLGGEGLRKIRRMRMEECYEAEDGGKLAGGEGREVRRRR